jgi:hypothetical protein
VYSSWLVALVCLQPGSPAGLLRLSLTFCGITAAEAVEFVDDDQLKPTGFGVLHHALEGGAGVGLGRAAGFFVDLAHFPAARLGQPEALLALGVQAPALDLLLPRYPRVDHALHGLFLLSMRYGFTLSLLWAGRGQLTRHLTWQVCAGYCRVPGAGW